MVGLNDPSSQARPKLVEELYDIGLIFCEAGPSTRTYMRVDQPGIYFDGQQRPVSERDAARAGFNVPYYRAQKRAKEIQDLANARADAIIRTDGAEALKSPEQKRQERTDALKAKAAKAVRQLQRETQRQADLMITRDLGEPPSAG